VQVDGYPAVTFQMFKSWLEAMNHHWTDLLVLPEGLIFSIREDANRRKLLPDVTDAEGMWKRLAVLLRLLVDRQSVWGDPRSLYGQAASESKPDHMMSPAARARSRQDKTTWQGVWL
jgi:hypothetical protein